MGSTHVELPLAREPLVSIVILAYRNAPRLRRCLASIQAHPGSAPLETVVVANGASADVASVLSETEGIRTIRSEVNLGFAGGCNLGARHAHSELIVLLNDDVEVQPCWLDPLVETANAHPEAGAVGSRMTFTDGTLHEAGQIVWRDGSTTAVGRGLPGDTRRYRYLRQVDYCSAASLLVRMSAWHAVGGMDPGYHPGYCEDVDLCFAIQETGERGARILYEPRSVVCHHEGSSFDSVWRDFLMERNRTRLVAKWGKRLAAHEPDPDRPGAFERALHQARGFPRRVLVATGRLPSPADGWLGRLVAELDLVRHAVVVATSEPWDEQRAAPFEALGVEVVEEPADRHVAHPEAIYDAVVLGPESTAIEDAVRRHQPHAAVLRVKSRSGARDSGPWQDAISAALLARAPERQPASSSGR